MDLALTLSTVCVDRGTREFEIVQVIVQAVACAFGFDEDEGACRGLFEEEIHEMLFFVGFLDVDDLLSADRRQGDVPFE